RLPVLGTAQVVPDLQVDVVANKPGTAVAQDNLDPARVIAAGRHDVRIGPGRGRAGRVGRQRVAVTGAIAGSILDRVRAGGIGRKERLAGRGGPPPGEAAQVFPRTLPHLEHEDSVAEAVADVLEPDRLP